MRCWRTLVYGMTYATNMHMHAQGERGWGRRWRGCSVTIAGANYLTSSKSSCKNVGMRKVVEKLRHTRTPTHPIPLTGCVCASVCVCEVDLLHDISIVRQTAGRELSLAITTTRSCTCSQGRKTLRKQRQCTTMRGRRVQWCRGQRAWHVSQSFCVENVSSN